MKHPIVALFAWVDSLPSSSAWPGHNPPAPQGIRKPKPLSKGAK